MEITGISTTYFAADDCPVAQIMSADGTLTEMPYEEAMKVLEAHRPKPTESINALERDVIGMLKISAVPAQTYSFGRPGRKGNRNDGWVQTEWRLLSLHKWPYARGVRV